VDDFKKRLPEDSVVQSMDLPAIQAQLALVHRDPSKALEILQSSSRYELGQAVGAGGLSPSLYPVWVRAEAYRAAGQGAEVAREYQKIIDHRGIVMNGPIGAQARVAYQDFFALWKDADPGVPVLIAAKSEYAKLK
jgi:hypothetical protein